MTDHEPIMGCPHCGSREAPRVYEDERHYQVLCDASTGSQLHGCGAAGPFEATEAAAIESWNLRTSPWRPIKEYDKETAELVDIWVAGPDRPHSIPRCYWNFVHQAWIPLGITGTLKPEDCPNPSHFMRLPDGPRTAK